MALPTLPSRWGHNDIEKQLQRMRDQQVNFRRNWNEAAKYYQGNAVKSNIQQSLSSDVTYKKSMDAYSSRNEKAKKSEALHRRREKLKKLLKVMTLKIIYEWFLMFLS